jgi:hypothetical protein
MNEPANIKHTMKKLLLFIGLGVHAQNITIALAEDGGGEARGFGVRRHFWTEMACSGEKSWLLSRNVA